MYAYASLTNERRLQSQVAETRMQTGHRIPWVIAGVAFVLSVGLSAATLFELPIFT